MSLEPSLDIDQLQDPEQFFSAYEKLECMILTYIVTLIPVCYHSLQPVFHFAYTWSIDAKEEIQRQTRGNMTGKREYDPSANPRRCRRSGILGYHQHFY